RGAAGADVLEGQAEHVGCGDRPVRALGEELAQVGAGEAEGRVAGEVGLGDLDGLPVDPRVVDVAGGEASRLEHRGAEHEGVDLDPAGGELVGDRGRFGDHVPAQRGVGAGDDVQALGGDARLEHAGEDPAV